MGFFYTGRVYKEVVGTSPTEQTVLAYLAFRADDKTGQCFPSVERIMRETHFSRSAVIRALDGLKKREVLCWVKGGRTKGGRALSNLYTIKLPPVDKSVDKSVDNFMEDAREEKARVSQRHPNIQITNIKQPVINIPRPGGGKRPDRGDLISV